MLSERTTTTGGRLVSEAEEATKTRHPKIFIGQVQEQATAIEGRLEELRAQVFPQDSDVPIASEELVQALHRVVPEFTPGPRVSPGVQP